MDVMRALAHTQTDARLVCECTLGTGEHAVPAGRQRLMRGRR
jgi:hypothetical protein